MKTEVWIQALVLAVVSLVQAGFRKERELSLQKYEKTESSWLVCPTCPQATRVRKRKKLEWCASRCKKDKKFKCRAFNFEKLSRTCHLLPFDRLSPGAQTQNNVNFTLYERKDYIRECIVGTNGQYRGRRSWTKSNITCQAWSDNSIHDHTFMAYRDKDLKDSYCRNPDHRLRPWCYTMDRKTPWEYCNISVCDSPGDPSVNVTTSCVQGKAADYRGTVSMTPRGLTCQRWDSQFPHNHSYLPQNYKCRDLRENYCRNPDGSDYPWCFTTDPHQRRASCTQIPRCDAVAPQKTECYRDNGEAYQGTLSMTRSGIPCGDWSHHINSRDPHSVESHVLLEKNYCRNPDRDKNGPWCYTSSSSRLAWDYCELKKCESPRISAPLNNLTAPSTSCIVHINTRIVGGHQVHGSDGSWVVSIQRENNHLCGGTLVREDWVLTDQQCFTSCVPDLKDYSVQVGLRHLNASSGHPRLHISRLVCGPEGSNLVLLKLERPAPVSEGATSIQLPVRECHIREGTNCTMYGWGETKNTGHEESLKAVTMPMVNNEVCSRLKDGAGDSRVCAGGKRGEGICDKDNGGPLVCQDHQRKVIIGVSVQRTKCASSQPALFVNVAFYSDWIYKVFKHYPS
ncbi:LOW QUALITY PROTEIN: hepatocyte growth factor-like [Gadus macrocephalus]|uniref:LOW QUALITY PROTEIN: hepatocyte growth factor-like n=1 Tax=Gadus macrocephalus TaxID=80720 RepID=UPI0028CB4F69|nr:LOW QUALITY PROTEIN: hepatocyte growth factor-like [Gadus macrocephalus]